MHNSNILVTVCFPQTGRFSLPQPASPRGSVVDGLPAEPQMGNMNVRGEEAGNVERSNQTQERKMISVTTAGAPCEPTPRCFRHKDLRMTSALMSDQWLATDRFTHRRGVYWHLSSPLVVHTVDQSSPRSLSALIGHSYQTGGLQRPWDYCTTWDSTLSSPGPH